MSFQDYETTPRPTPEPTPARGRETLREAAEAFVSHYRKNGGCGHCGGIPHTTTCHVGRIEAALAEAAERPAPGDDDEHRSVVRDMPGRPVAAPCALIGCHYGEAATPAPLCANCGKEIFRQ